MMQSSTTTVNCTIITHPHHQAPVHLDGGLASRRSENITPLLATHLHNTSVTNTLLSPSTVPGSLPLNTWRYSTSTPFSPATALALPASCAGSGSTFGTIQGSAVNHDGSSRSCSSFGSNPVTNRLTAETPTSQQQQPPPQQQQQQSSGAMPPPALHGTPKRSHNQPLHVLSPGCATGPHRVIRGDVGEQDGAHQLTTTAIVMAGATPQFTPAAPGLAQLSFNESITIHHLNSVPTCPSSSRIIYPPTRSVFSKSFVDVGELAESMGGRRSATGGGGGRPQSCVAVGTPHSRTTPANLSNRNSQPIRDARAEDKIPAFEDLGGDFMMALERMGRSNEAQLTLLAAKMTTIYEMMVQVMAVTMMRTSNLDEVLVADFEDVPPTRSGSALSQCNTSRSTNNNHNSHNISLGVESQAEGKNATNRDAAAVEKEMVEPTKAAQLILDAPVLLRCPLRIAGSRAACAGGGHGGMLLRHGLRRLIGFLCEVLIGWLTRLRCAAAMPPPATSTTTTPSGVAARRHDGGYCEDDFPSSNVWAHAVTTMQ